MRKMRAMILIDYDEEDHDEVAGNRILDHIQLPTLAGLIKCEYQLRIWDVQRSPTQEECDAISKRSV